MPAVGACKKVHQGINECNLITKKSALVGVADRQGQFNSSFEPIQTKKEYTMSPIEWVIVGALFIIVVCMILIGVLCSNPPEKKSELERKNDPREEFGLINHEVKK